MLEQSFIIERERNIKICCYYFIPEKKSDIRGIVQIVHGLGEHALRYREFASILVDNGYVVCAEDHRGHGRSVLKGQKMGHIADSNGGNLILGDMYALMEKTKIEFGGGLDYFLFGHSFGSFLARAFVIKNPYAVNALILSATKGDKLFIENFAPMIANVQKSLFGVRASSNLMYNLSTGGYSKKYFPKDGNSAAWLTSDKEQQKGFLEDPYCLSAPSSIATYIEIFKMIDTISNKENIDKMPKTLPIFIASGDKDVLGNFSDGVKKLYATYKSLGFNNLIIKIYKGLRHEILNEKDKDIVIADIVEWIKLNTKNILPSKKEKNIFKDFAISKKANSNKKASIAEQKVKKTASKKATIILKKEVNDKMATVKKSAPKKTTAVKKAAPKKTVTKKTTVVKKAAPKKTVTKKTTVVKKAAPKKTVTKKTTVVKKATPKKTTVVKKTSTKK